jgi:hypothetical protein
MAHPTGESSDGPLRLDFDSGFDPTQAASSAGAILFEEICLETQNKKSHSKGQAMSTEAEKANRVQILRLIATVLVGVIMWFAPIPTGIDPKAWHLFAIFVSVILGLILQPLPMGAVVLIGVITSALTKTLSIADALNGFANPTCRSRKSHPCRFAP